MDKRLIETKKTGICNFDYFCVDSTEKEITINGMTFPHGQIAWEVSMLGKEYITKLLLLGGYLRQSFLCADMYNFQIANYIEVKERILAVIDFVKDTPPFSHFDTLCSREVVLDVFSDEHLTALEREMKENSYANHSSRWYQMLAAFVNIYMYLCTDTANFATLILNFTQNAVERNCRDVKNLANLALIFFSSREVADLLDKSNPAECVEGVTMRPRATIVPAIPFDENVPDAVEIKKRIYYGRLMDFFVADFFDALACGHYLWQCKYCGRYFLMTTGHRQLYCQTPPPGEKHPCYKLAKNRRTATAETKANKQAAADNPHHILWKKCDDAIRKRKSRGSISADKCEKAQAYAKDCYDRAIRDPGYAEKQYKADIELEHIFKQH
ncbi:MAG: hypothetical protein IJA67_01810 [Oscillospiraceae bacterium]|nr:hypothetical protein [Oscillospiraceae bacterium]